MNPLDRLFSLVLDLKKDQDAIKEQTIKNTTILEEHMRRTEASENRLSLQETRIARLETQEKVMNSLWKIAVALAGFTGTVLGIIVAIRELQ
jgi:hypothetical protein